MSSTRTYACGHTHRSEKWRPAWILEASRPPLLSSSCQQDVCLSPTTQEVTSQATHRRHSQAFQAVFKQNVPFERLKTPEQATFEGRLLRRFSRNQAAKRSAGFETGPKSFNISSDLGGGVLVAVRHLNAHVVHGAAGGVQPAGDGDGSCVPLDVEVFLLVTTWKQDTEGEMEGGRGAPPSSPASPGCGPHRRHRPELFSFRPKEAISSLT